MEGRMGLRGVNRVLIAVRDLDASRRRYSELLGAHFEDAGWTGEPFGISVAIAWDAGIELCAPLPGRESDSAVSAFLERHGEGVMSVFFAVDDVETATRQAEAHGAGRAHALDYTEQEIDAHLGGHFRRYTESFLDTFAELGVGISLAAIEPKQAAR
jgi:catechol 2,3-dioxygenase-like lactoylglutathione lyase family enzyme